MSEHFVAEVFPFDGTTIGSRRRVLAIDLYDGADAKDALNVALDSIFPGEIIALYQGGLSRYGRRPVGFSGKWSIAQWEAIRDAYGGVEGVRAVLAQRRQGP